MWFGRREPRAAVDRAGPGIASCARARTRTHQRASHRVCAQHHHVQHVGSALCEHAGRAHFRDDCASARARGAHARARVGREVRARPLGARLQRARSSPAALGPRRAAPSGRRWVLERSRRAGRGLSGSVRDRSGERGEQWAPARCLRPIARPNACSDALGAQNPPRRAISRSATRILAEQGAVRGS